MVVDTESLDEDDSNVVCVSAAGDAVAVVPSVIEVGAELVDESTLEEESSVVVAPVVRGIVVEMLESEDVLSDVVAELSDVG